MNTDKNTAKSTTPQRLSSGGRGPFLKVCGMKYIDNIQKVAELQPDYLLSLIHI